MSFGSFEEKKLSLKLFYSFWIAKTLWLCNDLENISSENISKIVTQFN